MAATDMIATELLRIQNQLKVYHWQTNSYAKHVAFGGAYDDLGALIDGFVEVLMGIEGVVAIAPFKLANKNQKDENEFILESIDLMKKMKESLQEYPDLLNTADEMIGVLGKLKYLLTLK